MGRRSRNKRKKSDNSENNDSVCKAGRYTDSPQEEVCVSKLLCQTNSVLYSNSDDAVLALADLFGENSDSENSGSDRDQVNSPVPHRSTETSPTHTVTMDPTDKSSKSAQSPTNADIMSYLQKMNDKIGHVEKKLEKIDSLEKKVCSFEKEFTKLWNCMQDMNKKTEDRIGRAEDKIESVDFSLGVVNDKVVQLEKERDLLKDEVVYLQSQSMRNNLVFANIPEAPRGVAEDCEKELRGFLSKEMNIAQDLVDKLSFERVHRMGQKVDSKCRKIVAKFTLFKEREMVRKQWKALEGTNFYVHEQFPKEVVDKRRRLLPKLKEAKNNNKRAWLSYDTLYIDGKPVRDNNS